MDIVAIRNRILRFSFRRRKDPFIEMLESAPLTTEPVTEDDLRSLEEVAKTTLAVEPFRQKRSSGSIASASPSNNEATRMGNVASRSKTSRIASIRG